MNKEDEWACMGLSGIAEDIMEDVFECQGRSSPVKVQQSVFFFN